jgi:hypothetical protein
MKLQYRINFDEANAGRVALAAHNRSVVSGRQRARS